jgi:nucleoside-diphosphate-sugar epimerase
MILDNNIAEITNRLFSYKKDISGKTFLITGGAGFLGKNIVWTLQNFNKTSKNKCKIIVIDNYITGLEDQFEMDDNIVCLKQDISKPLSINQNVDYILHAAGIASPIFYSKYKLETIHSSLQGTFNILDLAVEKNSKSVLFFSTSEVYGSPPSQNVPTSENYNGNVSCVGPRAHYDEPKRMAETLCVTYADVFGVNVKIARPFNIYGPGMRLDDGRGLINILKSAVLNEDLPIYGDGLSTRTWTYITDGVVAFMKILFSDQKGEAFNVGIEDPEINSIDLGKLIMKITKSKSKLTLQDAPVEAYEKNFDVNRRCPDMSKMKKLLNFEAKITLEEGLKRTMNWIKEII